MYIYMWICMIYIYIHVTRMISILCIIYIYLYIYALNILPVRVSCIALTCPSLRPKGLEHKLRHARALAWARSWLVQLQTMCWNMHYAALKHAPNNRGCCRNVLELCVEGCYCRSKARWKYSLTKMLWCVTHLCTEIQSIVGSAHSQALSKRGYMGHVAT